MARPKKNLPPGKDKKFTIRVTDEMFEALESEANAAGLATSEYARKLLLDHRPIVKQEIVYDSEELLHTLGDMGKIGSNLNQMLEKDKILQKERTNANSKTGQSI